MKQYRRKDTTSLVLDILGEIPNQIKQEVKPVKGLMVFGHKTGSDIQVVSEGQFKLMSQDSSRHTYGSNLRRKSV